MAVPASITDLSVTDASNSPPDSESVTPTTRPSDYLRAHANIIRRLRAKGADVASATASGLGSNTDGDYFHVTGTTAIAAANFGTVDAGIKKTLVFDGALQLTHNATSFILPGGANITTAAGDVAEFTSEGSGNWRCTDYEPAAGNQPLDALLTALAAQTTAANNVQAYSGADTPTLLSTGTSSGNIPLVGTKSATESLAGLVEIATQAEAEAGTDNTVVLTALRAAQAISALTAGYISSPQTITSGGKLTLAHGLGSVPRTLSALLKCTDAAGEAGYAQNDVALPYFDQNLRYTSISADATNVYVIFSTNANSFVLADKSSGAATALTNSKWAFIVRAE